MENGLGSSPLSLCLDFHTNSFSTDRIALQAFLLYIMKKAREVLNLLDIPKWLKIIIKKIKSDFPHNPKNFTQQVLHQAHKFWS